MLERVREFFLLRDAEARVKTTPDEVRGTVARTLGLARQRRDAAETLWIHGAPAEAWRLAREAFDLAVEARRAASDAGVDARAMAIQAELDGVIAPALDADVSPAHAALFLALVDMHDVLARATAPIGLDSSAISRQRRQRIAATSAGVLGLVALLYFVLRAPRVIRAEASAAYAERYAAKMAVDGRTDTEWLLPDNTAGWIDLSPSPVRTIKALKLLNVHNGPFNDRATKDYTIEAFANGQPVKAMDGTFATFSETPEWVRVPLDVPKCDRIRVTVKSWHKGGGGIAEAAVE